MVAAVSMNVEPDDNDEHMSEDGDHNNEDTSKSQLTGLSRSWTVASAHVPTFSGGKVTHSFPSAKAVDADNDDEDLHPFLLLPIDGDVAIVDAAKGLKLTTIRGDNALPDEDEDEGLDQEHISAYVLARNNGLIMTCSRNQLIQQYAYHPSRSNPVELSKSWGKSGHTLPVTQMELHPSNVFLATGSVDGTVRVWDVRGAYVTHVFRPIAGGEGGSGMLSVTSVKWQDNVAELVVAIARDDGSIIIHDLRDSDNTRVLRDHDTSVTCMDWWNDSYFVSTGRDAVLSLWRISLESSKEKKKKGKAKKQVATKKKVYRRVQTIPIYEQVEGMVLIPGSTSDELVIATAGSKGTVKMWKTIISPSTTPQLKLAFEQPNGEAFGEARGGYLSLIYNECARDSAEGKHDLLIVVDSEHNLSYLSSELALDRTIVGHNDQILDLKVIPNTSTRVIVATNSPQVRIFELNNFSCDVMYGHTAAVLCVATSPCGRLVASSGKDRTMRLWHVESKRCVAMATGHTEPIGACGLSQKVGRYDVTGKAAQNGGGAFAITASLDKTLKRWNLAGVEELSETADPIDLVAATSVRGHDKDINIVCVAPNDSLVATGSQDKSVKLWNATDLSLKATLKGHRRGVWDCQFSPIDRVLATSSGDKTIKLWSLGDFSCVRTFQGHVASVLRVRFLSSGLQLLSAGGDGLLKLWTIRTNQCETTLDGHSNKVWALDMCQDGKTAVSGGADSRIVVWKDNTKLVEDELKTQEAETILLEQKLANHLRHKEFGKALELSLQADKPLQALKVINSIIETTLAKRKSPLAALQTHVKTWSLEQTAKVLKYCREWNTRARNSQVAMLVVKAVTTTVTVQKLACHQGIPEILAGITPYAERHFDRLDRLHMSSYLLDFTLSAMGNLDPLLSTEPDNDAFNRWEKTSKLVLPQSFVDGRIQVGGKDLVGKGKHDSDMDASDDEVVTVGDSDSDSSDDEGKMSDANPKGSRIDDANADDSSVDSDSM